jgi:hypothetical protein
MAGITFDIGAAFEQAFGYKTHAFDPKPTLIKGNGGIGSLSRTEFGAHGSEYYTDDALGNEYYMPVKLTYDGESGQVQNGALADITGSGSGSTGAGAGVLKDWYLPYQIVSISSRKTIVETPLTERRGTVKELISIQDYEITIKGFIVGAGNEFPESDVTLLRTIYEQNTAISIQCPLTDIFLLRPDRSGSDQVVIRELRFPSMPGVKNVRPYELHMISDAPFNLISII